MRPPPGEHSLHRNPFFIRVIREIRGSILPTAVFRVSGLTGLAPPLLVAGGCIETVGSGWLPKKANRWPLSVRQPLPPPPRTCQEHPRRLAVVPSIRIEGTTASLRWGPRAGRVRDQCLPSLPSCLLLTRVKVWSPLFHCGRPRGPRLPGYGLPASGCLWTQRP